MFTIVAIFGVLLFFVASLIMVVASVRGKSKKTKMLIFFPFLMLIKEYRDSFEQPFLKISLSLFILAIFLITVGLVNMDRNIDSNPLLKEYIHSFEK